MVTTRRLTLTWLILVGATLMSWWLGHDLGLVGHRFAAVAILLVTFVKVRFVVLDFMEVRRAPTAMRVIAQLWLAVVCVALILQRMIFTDV